MKRILYLLLLIAQATTWNSCDNKNPGFTLNGHIKELTDTTALLYGMFFHPDTLTTLSVENGRLHYTAPFDTLTPLYLYFPGLGREFPIFADKQTTIRIEGNANDPDNISISGSKQQSEYNAFLKAIKKINDKERGKELADSFITANPLSVVSIYLTDRYFVQPTTANEELVNRQLNNLGGLLHDHLYVNYLQDLTRNQSSRVKERFLPLITLPDTTGTSLTAKTLKDKLAVVSLWASWDTESRALQDSLKHLKKLMKKRPVVFINISLDSDKQQWIDAIRQDTLGGIQLCDFRGWESSFITATGARRLPANFVLDTNRRILLRDSWGKNLEELLDKQLQKHEKTLKKEEQKKRNKKK